MDGRFYIVLIVWAFLPSYLSSVIPKQQDDLDIISENGETEMDDEEAYEETDKHAHKKPKHTVIDRKHPDKPPLVLFEFPSNFGKEKAVELLEKEMGHVVDAETFDKIVNGHVEEIPSSWSFISKLDFKGAIVAFLAKQIFNQFKTVAEHPVILGISKNECKAQCKKTESKIDNFMAAKILQFIRIEMPDLDIRIKLRPITRRYFQYEGTGDESKCTCKDVKKNAYVSPRLKEIIDDILFNSKNAEERIEELIKMNPLLSDKAEESSSWGFGDLTSFAMYCLGFGSDGSNKSRRYYDYDRPRSSKSDYIIMQVIICFLISILCTPVPLIFYIPLAMLGFFFV